MQAWFYNGPPDCCQKQITAFTAKQTFPTVGNVVQMQMAKDQLIRGVNRTRCLRTRSFCSSGGCSRSVRLTVAKPYKVCSHRNVTENDCERPPAISETKVIIPRHDINLWYHKYCDKKFFTVYTAALKSVKELKQASQRKTTTADIPVFYKSNRNRHHRAILTDKTGKKAHID
ncbi:hypothetical protein T09_7850 [Trichinella sp. T9]|nr:hypothetical protein T09_7850 [Trichinella sp. T9]